MPHKLRRDIERLLNQVRSSTTTQTAETVAIEANLGSEDTNNPSHRAGRVTFAAVTMVSAPQQHREPKFANPPNLMLQQS